MFINIWGWHRRSYDYFGLYGLIDLVCFKAQTLSDRNSWITKLLAAKPRVIFKRIKEEQVELTLAVNFQVNHAVVMESIDLMLRVIILARSIGLNINNVVRLIDYWNIVASTQRFNKWSNFSRSTKSNYNRNYRLSMNKFRSNKLDNITLSRLNNSISNLFVIITKLGTNNYRYKNILIDIFYNILSNIITLICNRGVKYSMMISETIDKMA
ncbi:Phosphoribosyl-AMP cyclohydrolase [Candidatus Hodgkinia cicadicola]|uniref:Phosphoribosyl-AMP cyclohydrolase n=1 Tax=Candidatus Hodgkinia cicadicola TaxID=573658 RepID=A0ABX4MF15_9HYPH|nr:Phosphoribosyl-AMP cyclohydrolase [Candidatus Hodgkinia cicadicola]